jgi:hypothetical protein
MTEGPSNVTFVMKPPMINCGVGFGAQASRRQAGKGV